jgi:hypothetical protein
MNLTRFSRLCRSWLLGDTRLRRAGAFHTEGELQHALSKQFCPRSAACLVLARWRLIGDDLMASLRVLGSTLASGLCVEFVILITACFFNPSAYGVAFSGTGGDALTDLASTPNRIYRFDPPEDAFGVPVIRWKMTSQFRERFPLAKQREQVRLAIAEWEEGMFSAVRRAAPTYGWTRWSGASDFYDLRSIVTHEIGHALGANHPDAAWFNDSGDGSPYNQNYVRQGGNWVPAPPIGGEIMNEGNDATSLPGSKPPKGLGHGAYWRTLSQDELDFLDHADPTAIDFVEVGANDDADLVIDLFAVGAGPGSALGIGGVDTAEAFVSGDPSQGRRILTASAKVREEADVPIGFKALTRNWELTNNTGEPITSLIITARGTNNPIATSWSSSGPNKFTFQGATSPPQVPDPRAFNLEDVYHVYTLPQGGAINNGQSVGVGLRKDVWDWSVVESGAFQDDGDFVNIGLVSIMELNLAGVVVPFPDEPIDDFFYPDDGGLLALQGSFDIVAKGFQILNQESADVLISQVAYGVAPGLHPNQTELLNSDALGRLTATGDMQYVSLNEPLVLAPGESFYFLMAGTPSVLPGEVLQSGNWMLVSPPEGFMEEQMFVYAASQGGGFSVNNFALLNTPVFVPEPSSVALAVLGLFAFLWRGCERRLDAGPNRNTLN